MHSYMRVSTMFRSFCPLSFRFVLVSTGRWWTMEEPKWGWRITGGYWVGKFVIRERGWISDHDKRRGAERRDTTIDENTETEERRIVTHKYIEKFESDTYNAETKDEERVTQQDTDDFPIEIDNTKAETDDEFDIEDRREIGDENYRSASILQQRIS